MNFHACDDIVGARPIPAWRRAGIRLRQTRYRVIVYPERYGR